MKCPDCGGRTYVVNTTPQIGGIRRQRKCQNCGVSHHSGEVWLATAPPAVRSIYTKEEAAAIKRQQVDARRKNEDRRDEDAS